jgi:small-conductance mechanosensitive channel
MEGSDLNWWADHDWVRAVVIFAAFMVTAFVFDRWFAARGRRVAGRVLRGNLSQETDTRLRFVRRFVWLALIVFGTLAALSQFAGLGRIAGSLVASGVLVAAIVGFAARQTLGNLVAGIMLALTQPLRVGDWVTFEDNYGVVEDVRLNFTVLRTFSEQRIVIPNERLASGILRNDTLESGEVGLDVTLWLPADADVPRALDVLREETGQSVTIAESAADGTRLAVGGERVAPPERARHEAQLREQCLRRLRADGIMSA